jgi:SSS family solute:Na+ symporter
MNSFTVSTIDIVILIGYVVGVRVFFGWLVSKRIRGKGSEGYFLGGRRLTWPLIGLSFYVSNMSGSTFVALPGSAYHNGINAYNYEWMPALILVFFAVVMLPLFLRTRVVTAPEYLENRFDGRSRVVFSAFLLVANTFIDAAAALYAGATVMKVLFPGVPLWVTIAAAALVAGLYILIGGLEAVVLNDTLQAALIIVGGTVIGFMTLARIPSWDAVRTAVPPRALHLGLPASDPVMPWPGLVTGVLVVGIYFWCTNQFMIQRALGARSLNHGRWGAIFAGALKLPNLFILILPGVMATVLYPQLERPDLVFPTLAFDLLPIGLRGLILAALAAAILSSLESIYNSASTLFTFDFVARVRPGLSDTQLVRTGRWATVAFMVLSAAWAPQISRFPTLWQYLQSVLSYITPPAVAVFLLGMLWRRATPSAAMVTLVVGLPLGLVGWVVNELAGVLSIQYLYASGVVFAFSCALMVGISLVTRPTGPVRLHATVWSKALWQEDSQGLRGVPWYRNWLVLSALLLAVTAVVVVWWW